MPVGDEYIIELANSSASKKDPKPQSLVDLEVGVTASNGMPFGRAYQNMWEVPRQDDINIQKLVAMRKNDGQATALYRLMTIPILAALKTATFLPAPGQNGGEKEAKFAEQLLTLPEISGGMQTPFRLVLEQMLLAVFDGFSAFELVIGKPPTEGPLKGKYVLSKIAHRPSETVTFLVDDKGSWTGIRQRAYANGKMIDEPIYRPNCIYLAVNEEFQAHYGFSYFTSAFWHWDKKNRVYYLAWLNAQRSATGTRVGKYPKLGGDPKEVAEFGKQLQNMATNNWIRIRDDYSIESLKEGGDADFLGLINHHNAQMSKSILASFFDQNQGAGQSDQTLVDFGNESDALFIMLLESITAKIEDIINQQILPRFIKWNFGNDKYPEFRFGAVSKDKIKAIMKMFEVISIAANQGNMTRDFPIHVEKAYSDYMGIEIDYEAEMKRQDEQHKLADQAQAQAAQNPNQFGQQSPQQPGQSGQQSTQQLVQPGQQQQPPAPVSPEQQARDLIGKIIPPGLD